jgi:monoamine oxidase
MATRELLGKHFIVAGAGLAGLSAARDLESAGASGTIAEARDRVGGRVHTLRSGFAGGMYAEAGADLIEAEQSLVLELAAAIGLKPVRISARRFQVLRARSHRPQAAPRRHRRLQRVGTESET